MARREIRVKKKKQNSLAIILVTMVVLIMMIVVMANNKSLKEKLAVYQEREQILNEQIEAEKERAQEIEEFEKYTKTKKYIEDVAREKLGLVYEDEIIIQTEDD
ncbi:MAG: septum formation initiator family protein [Lachnospiraceae bacterium]|nr:septum formation initiator family protein [Lachnospiraceae bacterium]